jgi:hypothetical protein
MHFALLVQRHPASLDMPLAAADFVVSFGASGSWIAEQCEGSLSGGLPSHIHHQFLVSTRVLDPELGRKRAARPRPLRPPPPEMFREGIRPVGRAFGFVKGRGSDGFLYAQRRFAHERAGATRPICRLWRNEIRDLLIACTRAGKLLQPKARSSRRSVPVVAP